MTRASVLGATLRRASRADVLVGMLVLCAALGLKQAYSAAGAEQLAWVLAPSCWLASHVGVVTLSHEAGAGWINHEVRMVVGPACAGVNFLVVAWLSLFFSLQLRFVGAQQKLIGGCLTLLAAYGATLLTNGLRIALAAELYGADIYGAWLTPARLHRMLGIVLYVTVLIGLCRGAELCVLRARQRAVGPLRLGAFGWYAAVAVGLPLINRAFIRDADRFAEHAAWTLGLGAAVWLVWQVLGRLVIRLCSRRARA